MHRWLAGERVDSERDDKSEDRIGLKDVEDEGKDKAITRPEHLHEWRRIWIQNYLAFRNIANDLLHSLVANPSRLVRMSSPSSAITSTS